MLSDPAVAALKKAHENFVFFPAIRGIEANQWRFGEVTRIEFSATNAASGNLVWFPRSNVSYVTVEEGGLTVALKREMRYSGTAVWPVRASGTEEGNEDRAAQQGAEGGPDETDEETEMGSPATVAPPAFRRKSKSLFSEPLTLVLGSVAVAAIALVLVLTAAQAWLHPAPNADSAPITDSRIYTLGAADNHGDIVRKLGAAPDRERGLSLAGSQIQQHALIYRSRNYAVITMGVEGAGAYSQEPRYIGAVRLSDGAVVATISITHNADTAALVRKAGRQVLGEK